MRKQDGRRRRKWIIGGAIAVLVLAWMAILAVKAVSAYHHDQQGLAALQQVRSQLGPDDLTSTASVDQLEGARAQFDAASSDLSSPLFGPITIVPVIGRQLRSVRALSSVAGTVSGVGSSFITQVHGVLHQPHGAGPDRVSSLQELSAVSRSAGRQLAHVDTGPSQALVAPLASKHDEFISQLDEARVPVWPTPQMSPPPSPPSSRGRRPTSSSHPTMPRCAPDREPSSTSARRLLPTVRSTWARSSRRANTPSRSGPCR